jgi:hypothetical protein
MQQASMSQRIDSENVRLKAYELWIKGGQRDGVAEQNWLEAEKILSSTQAAPSTHSAPTSQPPKAPQAAPVTPASQSFKTAAKPNGNASGRKR